jgi:hypothetical protein
MLCHLGIRALCSLSRFLNVGAPEVIPSLPARVIKSAGGANRTEVVRVPNTSDTLQYKAVDKVSRFLIKNHLPRHLHAA